MDIGMVFTLEEVILDTKRVQTTILVVIGLAISHASFDKAIEEERALQKE